jgi:hypothetical protein
LPVSPVDPSAAGVHNRGGRKSRFTLAEFEAIRRAAETTPVAEVARHHGITEQYV